MAEPNKRLGFHGGKNGFLSNFCQSLIWFGGIQYPTVEHAFQGSKTLDWDAREKIALLKTPAEAKQVGRTVTLRPDWEQMKLDVMYKLLQLKFGIPLYKQLLLATGDDYLEETNTWGDTYWGVCNGVGENHLGKLLMRVRDELRGTK